MQIAQRSDNLCETGGGASHNLWNGNVANLGGSQLAAGSLGEALAAAAEAVALHRKLAGSRPESFQSDLAKSLYHLAMIIVLRIATTTEPGRR